MIQAQVDTQSVQDWGQQATHRTSLPLYITDTKMSVRSKPCRDCVS